MKLIEYIYSYHSWGFDKEELYRIDMEKKEYQHFDHGVCDCRMRLSDDLLNKICSFFEMQLREFPDDEISFDAPRWTLTIDDKTCTRVAVSDWDPLFKSISSFFSIFKNIK